MSASSGAAESKGLTASSRPVASPFKGKVKTLSTVKVTDSSPAGTLESAAQSKHHSNTAFAPYLCTCIPSSLPLIPRLDMDSFLETAYINLNLNSRSLSKVLALPQDLLYLALFSHQKAPYLHPTVKTPLAASLAVFLDSYLRAQVALTECDVEWSSEEITLRKLVFFCVTRILDLPNATVSSSMRDSTDSIAGTNGGEGSNGDTTASETSHGADGPGANKVEKSLPTFPPTPPNLATLLLSTSLLPAFTLLDFIRLYRPGNAGPLSVLLAPLVSTPIYLREFRRVAAAASDQLVAFTQVVDRAARTMEQAHASNGSATPHDQPMTEAVITAHAPLPIDLTLLTSLASTSDLLVSLEPFVFLSPPLLTTTILKSPPDLLGALMDAYDACSAAWIPMGLDVVNKNASPRPEFRHWKLAALGLIRACIESAYLRPLAASWDPSIPALPSTSPSTTPPTPAHLSTSLSSFLHPLIDRSPGEDAIGSGPGKFLEQATVLVDMDVEWDLRSRAVVVRDAVMDGEDAGMDYLVFDADGLGIEIGDAIFGVGGYEVPTPTLHDDAVPVELSPSNGAVKSARQAKKRGAGQTQNGDNAMAVVQVEGGVDFDEKYITRSSLISQVRDLFPELGDGFVEAGLGEFGDDPELLIMKILEDDLPPRLAKLPRDLPRAPPPLSQKIAPALPPRPESTALVPYASSRPHSAPKQNDDVLPSYTFLPTEPEQGDLIGTRRNVFDGDEFDVFRGRRPDKEAVILGKKRREQESAVLADRSALTDTARAAILEQQYEFDEYDDEYDDTYDDLQTGQEEATEEDEEIVDEASRRQKVAPVDNNPSPPFGAAEPELVRTFQTNPGLFDTRARRTPERAKLRQVTGMADEQLEGWFTMLMRDPNKDRVLSRYEWRGNRPPPPVGGLGGEEEEEEDSEGEGSGDQSGQQHGNSGRGGFVPRGGRGGQVGRGGRGDGPGAQTSDRRWKDQNKAKVGNHNRKSGHDRKMARGAAGWQ
ncbi:hypothetical protein HDU93_007546 [Gonapodya sp. JEL0774]|nr:hypothetical protein HDU93_007546 [Gonapodya sp. JEL0774]